MMSPPECAKGFSAFHAHKSRVTCLPIRKPRRFYDYSVAGCGISIVKNHLPLKSIPIAPHVAKLATRHVVRAVTSLIENFAEVSHAIQVEMYALSPSIAGGMLQSGLGPAHAILLSVGLSLIRGAIFIAFVSASHILSRLFRA
jgi:hypothetical protein